MVVQKATKLRDGTLGLGNKAGLYQDLRVDKIQVKIQVPDSGVRKRTLARLPSMDVLLQVTVRGLWGTDEVHGNLYRP